MSRGDAYLWSKFNDKFPNIYDRVEYDVRVGEAVTLPDPAPDWLRRSARDLSRKRIDVVAETTNSIFIIEVRTRAKSSVIGDLISYRYLYNITFNPKKKLIPVLITDSIDADLMICLTDLKLLYHVV